MEGLLSTGPTPSSLQMVYLANAKCSELVISVTIRDDDNMMYSICAE